MESPRGVPVKTILKKYCTFTGECPWRNLISIKLLCSFKEITLPYGCFPVNLLHFFRTPFLWTPLDGCFWAFWATSRLLLFIRAPLEECFWNYIKKIKFRECQHFRNAVFQYFSIANNSYSVKSIHIWRFFWSVFGHFSRSKYNTFNPFLPNVPFWSHVKTGNMKTTTFFECTFRTMKGFVRRYFEGHFRRQYQDVQNRN